MRLRSGLMIVVLLQLPIFANEPTSRVDKPVETGLGLRIYSDEIFAPAFGRILYGYDRDEWCTVSTTTPCDEDTDCNDANANDVCGQFIDGLIPGTQTNIWDLVCDPLTPGGADCQVSSWDFSGINPTNYTDLTEIASTTVPNVAGETCATAECGFPEGDVLTREDRGHDTASVVPTVSSIEFEDRAPQDHSIWLRAAIRNEGVTQGELGQNESRVCYVGDDGGSDRTVVPLWQFQHCDAEGCYMQLDDSWGPEHPATGVPQPFQCERSVFNTCTGACGLFCALYAYGAGPYDGGQYGDVVNEGLVTLPSGHTLKALVVRSNAEFRLALFSSCGNSAQNVRTVLYLWVVPNLGTVVRLQSKTNADDVQDFNAGEDLISEMDVKFGNLPPRSVSVDAFTDTTVSLSWDPGLLTHRIDGYRIYWDTDSGADSSYSFDSDSNPDQVSFAGPSATISGLTPGTTYYFTVTTLSNFQHLSEGSPTAYESLLYPARIPADPFDLPVELFVTTAAGGSGAVPDGDSRPGQPLLIDKGTGSELILDWGASCQIGDTDYAIYEGPVGDYYNYEQEICSTGGLTTDDVTPAAGNRFFVVVPNSGVSEGSYGLDSADDERDTSGACLSQNIGDPVCP